MLANHESLRGIVHGKVIQLETEIGLPDGQEVAVSVRPLPSKQDTPSEGLHRSAGTWSDDPHGLDAYIEKNRLGRQLDSPGIEP